MKLTTTIDVQLGRGQNMREHYAVRANRVKAEREATWAALCDALPAADVGLKINALSYGPDIGARITLHRPWARVPLDSDNLSGAFKGVRDEVASFLGVDDRSERLHWIYTQSKQPKGTLPTIVIEVMPVADIDPQVKRIRELEAAVAEMEAELERRGSKIIELRNQLSGDDPEALKSDICDKCHEYEMISDEVWWICHKCCDKALLTSSK